MRKELHIMKNGWGILGIVMVVGLAMATPAKGAELKIGVVEPQKVLENTKSGKKVKDKLEEYQKSAQKMLDMDGEELKKIQEDYVKQGSILSPEAKKDKEESLRRKEMEYQRKFQQLNQDFQGKKKELLEEFSKSLEQTVKGIAEKEKISIVVEKSDAGPVSLVIYSSPSLDITDRVIKELDKGGK
jgi:outer membrane protein